MARKQFGPTQQVSPEDLEFDIVGFNQSTKQPFAVTFRRLPELQGRKITNLMKRASAEGGAGDVEVIFPFIEGCLADDQEVARFQRLTDEDNKEEVVAIDTLSELVNWLVEQYGGSRPLEQSASLLPGQIPTPHTSMDTGY